MYTLAILHAMSFDFEFNDFARTVEQAVQLLWSAVYFQILTFITHTSPIAISPHIEIFSLRGS